MKRIFTIIFACFVAGTSVTIGQIKVIANGNVGINNTSPAYKLDVSGNARLTFSGYSVLYEGSVFYPAYGSYVSLGSYSNYWYSLYAYYPYFFTAPYIFSDISIKKDIISIPTVSEKIKLLKPVSYKLNPVLPDNTPEDIRGKIYNTIQYGFIAQEIQKVFPDLVAIGEDGLMSIQYNGLIPVLVKALQEQQSQIEELLSRVSELEKKVK
jgi:hypothetical protein